MSTDHHDVCLTISSYRNDDAVMRILASAMKNGDHPFQRIIVVDSMSTGRVTRMVSEKNWPRVDLISRPTNLGSAGNLAERLVLAARTGARFAYCLNHDSTLNLDVVASLRAAAGHDDSIAAAYPLRAMTGRGGQYEMSYRLQVPVRRILLTTIPKVPWIDVWWSSSNGALYALDPVRSGLSPWPDLWMGWEDLEYGWQLRQNGYRQVVVTSAIMQDAYEYTSAGPTISDKPSWYAYYSARNLLLSARRTQQPLWVHAAVLGRIAAEMCLTLAARPQKATRIRLLLTGTIHGMRGVTGKWVVP